MKTVIVPLKAWSYAMADRLGISRKAVMHRLYRGQLRRPRVVRRNGNYVDVEMEVER